MILNNFKNVEKLIILHIGYFSKINSKNFQSKAIRGERNIYKYKKNFQSIDFNKRGIDIINYENEYPDFEFIVDKIQNHNFLEKGNVLIINHDLKTFFDLRSEIDKLSFVSTYYDKLSKDTKIVIPDGMLEMFFNLCLFNVKEKELKIFNLINYEELNTTNGIKRTVKDIEKILDLINYNIPFYTIDRSPIYINKVPKKLKIELKRIVKQSRKIINIKEMIF